MEQYQHEPLARRIHRRLTPNARTHRLTQLQQDTTTNDRESLRRVSAGAPYIQRAVDEHGEDWVLEHYYEQLYPLGQLMAMPEKHELPFYDADEHDTMTEDERIEMYQALAEYRENLRTGTKPGE